MRVRWTGLFAEGLLDVLVPILRLLLCLLTATKTEMNPKIPWTRRRSGNLGPGISFIEHIVAGLQKLKLLARKRENVSI